MNEAIIKTTGLSHSYGKGDTVLDDVNLLVEKGSIYGFLGPNGSGKTTTLSLLLWLLKTQKGSIEIFGKEFKAHRISVLKRVGSLIEAPSLYNHLTAKENLEVYRGLYGAPKERIKEVLAMVDLENTGKEKAKQFSLGMKQRLSIGLALLPNPELLVLDEPTNGLDPNGIIELRKLIRKLNKTHGITILVSSHILAEVEKMVSHVGIISQGKMIFQGTLDQLHQLQMKDGGILLQTSDNEAALRLLQSFNPTRSGDSISIPVTDKVVAASINKQLVDHQLDVYLLQPKASNLEQLFIDLATVN